MFAIEELKQEQIFEAEKLIHCVWNATYKGMIDDRFFDILKKKSFTTQLESHIQNNNSKMFLAIEESSNKICGMIAGGPTRSSDYPLKSDCELFSFNIMPEYQGRGVGKLLFQKILHWFQEKNFNSMILHATKQNTRARKIYEKYGGIEVGEVEMLYDSFPCVEVFYFWDKIPL